MKIEDSFTHKYHPQPRLSAGQVGGYLAAPNATNRKQILREAKFPSTVPTNRYQDAKSALISHLISRGDAGDLLSKRVQMLHRKADGPDMTDYKRANCSLCIDAIETFQAYEARMGLGKLVLLKPPTHSARLKISGVHISVSLDFMVEKVSIKGIKSVGGAMLVFFKGSETDRSMLTRCNAITLLIQEILKHQLPSDQTLDPTLCMAIDVFGGNIHRAKGPQKPLLKTVENSCGEVASMWPSIDPPPKYNGPPFNC